MAVGSCLLLPGSVERRRSWPRATFGWAFVGLVRILLPVEILDAQCGFKMFRREVGREIFVACLENGYLFDLHILATADRLGCRVVEAPVSWHEVLGSKIHLLRDSGKLVRGLLRLRRPFGRARAASEPASPRESHWSRFFTRPGGWPIVGRLDGRATATSDMMPKGVNSTSGGRSAWTIRRDLTRPPGT